MNRMTNNDFINWAECQLSSLKNHCIDTNNALSEFIEEFDKRKNMIVYDDDNFYSIDYLVNHFDKNELGKVIISYTNYHTEFKSFIHHNSRCVNNQREFKNIKLGNIIELLNTHYGAVKLIVVDFHPNGTIGLFPVANLFEDCMNYTDTTNGGYEASKMKLETIPKVYNEFKEIFNNIIIDCDLLDNFQLFGKQKYQICLNLDTQFEDKQLPLFKFISLKELINLEIFARESFWLRGVASSAYFCFALSVGYASYTFASSVRGVRPLIYVG